MFRQYVLITLLVIVAVSFAACGNQQSSTPLPFPTSNVQFITATPIPGDPTSTPVFIPQDATLTPTFVLPTLTAYPDDMRFTLGQSIEGRDIWAWQFGDGPFTIVLVGGIHGGFEGNTVVLAEELVEHFRETPEDVLPGVQLVIIPAANPDGLLRGRDLAGRFNARGVDLNRNWGCEWSDTTFIRDIAVDPGPRPFSEPETLALRTYFVASNPDAVVFYHSQAGGVFMGECGGTSPADWMGELLSSSTGYPYGRFDYYEISGDATNWLAERGVPAAIIELYTSTESELERNLRGVMALQCHFAVEFAGGEIEKTVDVVREKCD